jgi:hypothetical protein
VKKIRSGGSTVLFIVGIAFLVVSLAATAGFGIATAATGEPLFLIGLAGAALFFVLGAGMLLMGWRTGAVLDAQGIGWTPMIGGRRFTPWDAVQQVRVPGDADPATCVQLLLRDGSVEEVKAISKPKNGETNRHWASKGYLSRGRQVLDAHQAWLTAAGQGRAPGVSRPR